MKLFNSHISFEQLSDAADGSLPLDQNSAAHIQSCEHCSGEFAALERTIGLMRRDDSAAAPAAAFNFAVNLFRSRKAFVPQEEKSLVKQILATLTMDLSNFAPAFGERSAIVADERQMLFAAGDFDIDLRVAELTEGFAVRGQVLGDVPDNCFVRLENSDFRLETAVDEFGSFSFAPVPSLERLQVSLVIK